MSPVVQLVEHEEVFKENKTNQNDSDNKHSGKEVKGLPESWTLDDSGDFVGCRSGRLALLARVLVLNSTEKHCQWRSAAGPLRRVKCSGTSVLR